MKLAKQVAFIVVIMLFWSCNNNDDGSGNNPRFQNKIEIGNYAFYFPDGFVLQEGQGIDSYIGNVNGNNISLFFDYGWYTLPVQNLPANEYIVTEDEINGHFRQIVKPIDAQANYTRIHLYKISEQMNNDGGYNSLTMLSNNLSAADQELIIEVFNTVQIIN